VAIDYILEEFSKEKQREISPQIPDLLDLFSHALLKSTGIDDNLWRDDPLNGLFDEALSQQNKRFIAICLLRLLDVNDKPFEREDFRVKTFKLFDETLSSDIYQRLNINTKDQTYQKRSKLEGLVSKVENEFSDLTSSFDNLNVLHSFRHSFLQKINDEVSKAILWPFLPRKLVDVPLKEVFKVVEAYVDEEEKNLLQCFNRAAGTLKSYLAETQQHGNKYSCDYLGGLAKKLLDLLEKHFKEHPLSKPANLTIDKSEKKYPFYIKDKEIDLSFIVRNNGPGYAFDVYLEFEATITAKKSELYIGDIEPLPASVRIEIPCKIERPQGRVLVSVKINWTNIDGSHEERSCDFELEGQRSDIDWEVLEKEEPYGLEPVTTEEELVGRREILNQLESLTKRKHLGSAFIYGQKRVGKTSIVRTLKNRLDSLQSPNLLIIYLEAGEYIHPDPETTIENLGKRVVREIQMADRRFDSLDVPNFEGSLSPLAEFLESVTRIHPNFRILFVLDEFDELPVELYKRGPLGDAFFQALRSISGKPPFCFILVGGERMEVIISCQGDTLNKFQSIRVDYFDKEKHLPDFQELVRRPVRQWFEITDEALTTLYNQAAGNPFFTKLICSSLFNMMVERRDSHVTPKEIEETTERALQAVASNVFQHFWEDGIFETGVRAEEISIQRRKVLLALVETIRQYRLAKKENIVKQATKWGLKGPIVENELREFERRQVLVKKNEVHSCKVAFFEKWLVERGIHEIIITFTEYDESLRQKEAEERARITSQEIVELVNKWGVYKGRKITEDQVRAWLNQFADNESQRLMLKILQNIIFYAADSIRAKMKEAQGIVQRGLVLKLKERRRKRGDILVSYLDNPGKSGAYLAKLYADENNIYKDNVIERSKITETLKAKTRELHAFALVFVDDFVGTGNSACQYFRSLVEEHGETLKKLSKEPGEIPGTSKLQMFFITITGFQEAQAEIEEVLEFLALPVKVHICDPLDESAKAFSNNSQIFTDLDERDKAKRIAEGTGSVLVKNAPLGYGDCQTTVVFEHNCPNNSLPILWGESKNWLPLFKRLR
jgi:hypothetical protein